MGFTPDAEVFRLEREGEEFGFSYAMPIDELGEPQRSAAYVALGDCLVARCLKEDDDTHAWGDYLIVFRNGDKAGYTIGWSMSLPDLDQEYQLYR
jgi:hypothetical protein